MPSLTLVLFYFVLFKKSDSYNKPLNFTNEGGHYDHIFHFLINNVRSHPPQDQTSHFWGFHLRHELSKAMQLIELKRRGQSNFYIKEGRALRTSVSATFLLTSTWCRS